MSVAIGVYDFFAYTIPGALFLFVFNEFYKLFGHSLKDIYTPGDPLQVVGAVLLAYIAGHVVEYISFLFWSTFLHKRKEPWVEGLNDVQGRCPEIKIKFEPRQWTILLGILHQRNSETTYTIDKFKADALTMRNLSFIAVLLASVEVSVLFIQGWQLTPFILLITSILVAFIAFKRADRYDYWYYRTIFAEALNYGTSLKEILKIEKKKKDKK